MKGHLEAGKLLSDKLLQNIQYDETIFSHNSQDIVEVCVNTTPGPLLTLSNPALKKLESCHGEETQRVHYL